MTEQGPPKKGRKRKYSSISERLEARKIQDQRRVFSRVNIGENITEWLEIKKQLRCNSHASVAKVLLDCFRRRHESSTPKPGVVVYQSTPGMSDIGRFNDSRTLTGSMVSGIFPRYISNESPLPSTVGAENMSSNTLDNTDPFGMNAVSKGDVTWTPSRAELYSSDSESELSDGTAEVDTGSCSDHDEDNENLDLLTEGDVVFNIADSDEQVFGDSESEAEEVESELNSKESPMISAKSVVNENKCIAFSSCLDTLAKTRVSALCPRVKCGKRVTTENSQRGSAFFIKWTCEAGHTVHKWSSQPKLGVKGTNAGDFLLASNILLSGNNYQKIALLFKFMKIGIISRTTFDNVQREFCFPAIDHLWDKTLETTLGRVKDKDKIVLAGDGRNDSPGFSAMYCTYTLMDHETKDIVSMEIMDKRMTGGNSPVMEKEALRKSLQSLKEKNVPIVELVTDANASVAAMIKQDFPGIRHQYDLWHGSKNLGKKIQAISREKGNTDLKPWKKKITNHFWACSERCTSEIQLKGMWVGVLHHVVDAHEWVDLIGSGETQCAHNQCDEDDREAKWLEPDSKPHQSLRAVVLETRLQNTLKYYVNFRHTGFLETFHSHILMYSSKRFAFTWPSYKARNTLAALDWQIHKDRAEKTDKNGQPIFKRRYSKNSNRWTVNKVKVEKTYPYIPNLLEDIVQRRMNFRGQIPRVELQPDDPRLLRRSIASILPESTETLTREHQSRFASNTLSQT